MPSSAQVCVSGLAVAYRVVAIGRTEKDKGGSSQQLPPFWGIKWSGLKRTGVKAADQYLPSIWSDMPPAYPKCGITTKIYHTIRNPRLRSCA
jgi:hypothetical protein